MEKIQAKQFRGRHVVVRGSVSEAEVAAYKAKKFAAHRTALSKLSARLAEKNEEKLPEESLSEAL